MPGTSILGAIRSIAAAQEATLAVDRINSSRISAR
jgi:hypothetical protein